MAFTDPIATTAPPFTVASGAHSIAPHTYFTYTSSKVMPTNAWWQNLLITHIDSGNYNGKTATFPFAQWPATSGKGIAFSYHGTQGRSVAANAITLSSVIELSLEMNETISTRQITDHTDLGVTLRFNHSGGNMTTSLVQGMAFHSGTYTSATPVITSQHPILLMNGSTPVTSLTNVTKVKIRTAYYNRDWIIYASQPISFTVSGQTLTATAPFNGSLQIAHIASSSDEAVYDAAASSILTGGSVNATYSGNNASMVFNFTSTGSGSPLVFALPHHQDLMTGASFTDIRLLSLKGTMRALQAQSWTLTEPLTPISWFGSNPLPSSAETDILAALAIEKDTTYDSVGNGYGVSPYYMGKYVAKMARLSLIAEEAGNTSLAASIRNNIKTQISNYLGATPTGSFGVNGSGYINALIYQGGSTWKGISTQNGLADMGADFGSGRFNDHHFHYGYWIYAAAVVARSDNAWRVANKQYIDALIRDIANPSATDAYFPRFRHKDWFAGHSYAGGLVGIDVGPGQESASEAINAWYGVHLWGLANTDTELSNLGRLLLATEIRSTKRYWHIYNDSDIYEAPFNTHGTAVIVRTHKVAVETYFGSQPHYFYGIETLPFTPISEEYIDQPWAARSYAAASANIPATVTGNPMDTGWNSVIYSFHAVINPDTAYEEIQNLALEQIPEYDTFVQYGRNFDNGHSKANALWWASTRAGFSGADPNPDPDPEPEPSNGVVGPEGSNSSASPFMAYAHGPAVSRVRTTTTADYTATVNDTIIAFTTLATSRTVTLPSTNVAGQILVIKDESGNCSSARTITISGVVDGQDTTILSTPYVAVRLYNNGASWSKIS